MDDTKDITSSAMPEGWTIATLGDVCTPPQYGWTTSANKSDTGLRLLRTSDISGGPIDWSAVPVCTEQPRDPEKYLLNPGDIVVSRAGSVGISQVIKNPSRAIFASYLIRFHPLPPIESDFLGLFLQSPLYWASVSDQVIGNTIGNVNASKLKQLTLPLPPLAEQKRIVAKVEELLARVNTARERLDRVPKIMKRFRQAVLAAACSGRLTEDWREAHPGAGTASDLLKRITHNRVADYERLCQQASRLGQRKPRRPANLELRIANQRNDIEVPESWFWMSLESISSTRPYAISSGPFGSALGTKDYTSSGVPVIRGQNVQSGYFVLSNLVHISEEKAADLARSTASPGDIVVVAVGTSGQAAIVPEELPASILSQNCNKITVDTSLALPDYVVLFLQIEIAKEQLREKTTDTARPFLSLTNLKSTIIAVPPLEEQREIVRRVEALFKLADAIEKRVALAKSRADKLTQSILAKAFRGELVPTEAELAIREGWDYEPASVLLERIRTESKKQGRGGQHARLFEQ